MRNVWKAALMFAAVLFSGSALAEEFSPEKKSEIERIVRDYLIANPEVLEEAFVALQAKRQEAEAAERKAALASYKDKLFHSERQVVLGNPDGDVTLVEFFDYNCPYCKRAMGDMERLLAEDDKLRVVLKEFPVLGQNSVEAAQVAIAVNEVAPQSYREFHREMFGLNRPANREVALSVAERIDLSRDDIEAAMETDVVQETVEEVYGLANALGLTGTPSYVVGDEILFGAVGYDRLKQAVRDTRCKEPENAAMC